MKMFAVAFMSYSDNELKQSIVFAESSLAAMVKVADKAGFDIDGEGTDEEFIEAMFDCDCNISAIEVVIT